MPPTSGAHRLRCGLPGYLILFDPHTFEPQRQIWPRGPPSPLVFFPISTHFTATPGILSSSTNLYFGSFRWRTPVKPEYFTPDFPKNLHSLYA